MSAVNEVAPAASIGRVEAQTIHIESLVFDNLFPFHFLVDSELRIRSSGSVLARLIPEVRKLPFLFEAFDVLSPCGVDGFARLRSRLHLRFILRAKSVPQLELRGQFVAVNGAHRLAFLATPRLNGRTMTELGLRVEDFPAHDGIADYLALFEAQHAALADTARLTEDLARLNAELDGRVERRTRELEAANEQLRGASTDLREAKRQLELEMTERSRIESELRIAHRLEAVGQLAAGIAHEINTPIQYVSDSVQFVRDALEDLLPLLDRVEGTEAWEAVDGGFLVERIPEAIGRSLKGLERVASIVRAMKAFAHPGSTGKEPADINALVDNTLTVCRNEYKYVADLVTELGPMPPVNCNVAELGQVLLNLVVNAAHAIGERVEGTEERGTICVKTAVADDRAIISIGDDGRGIPEQLRTRIFDPFFTTKPIGKGTGQGLTLARNIIVKHGGTIDFTSTVGRGTTFVVSLPLNLGP